MDEGLYRFVAFAGFLIVGFLAWLTGRRGSVNWKTIGGSFVLAWVLGGLTFWFPWSRQTLSGLNDILIALLNVYPEGEYIFIRAIGHRSRTDASRWHRFDRVCAGDAGASGGDLFFSGGGRVVLFEGHACHRSRVCLAVFTGS